MLLTERGELRLGLIPAKGVPTPVKQVLKIPEHHKSLPFLSSCILKMCS